MMSHETPAEALQRLEFDDKKARENLSFSPSITEIMQNISRNLGFSEPPAMQQLREQMRGVKLETATEIGKFSRAYIDAFDQHLQANPEINDTRLPLFLLLITLFTPQTNEIMTQALYDSLTDAIELAEQLGEIDLADHIYNLSQSI